MDYAHLLNKGLKNHKVALVKLPTGIGKTLALPVELAAHFGMRILVLQPRRFNAQNAAAKINEIVGSYPEGFAGYAIGRNGRDHGNHYNANTQIVFATYGKFLTPKMFEEFLRKFPIIVLDEVHERNLDMTIVRGLLHQALQNKNPPQIVEVSATMNVGEHTEFWADVRKAQLVGGNQVPQETFARKKILQESQKIEDPTELAKAALSLIDSQSKTGIAVFCSTVANCDLVAKKLFDMRPGIDVKVMHSRLSDQERELALNPPINGKVKVIVTTPVLESGVNIFWLDATVHSGWVIMPRTNIYGATRYERVLASQLALLQQLGRVRKDGSIAILVGNAGFDHPKRIAENGRYEMNRVPLEEALLTMRSLNIDPTSIKLDANPSTKALNDALQNLANWGLVQGSVITGKGRFCSRLEMPLYCAIIAWEAHIRGLLPKFAQEIAWYASGGIRHNYKNQHGSSNHSDMDDGIEALRSLSQLGGKKWSGMAKTLNVDFKKYGAMKKLVESLRKMTLHESAETNASPPLSFAQIAMIAHPMQVYVWSSGSGYESIFSQPNKITESAIELDRNRSMNDCPPYVWAQPMEISPGLTILSNAIPLSGLEILQVWRAQGFTPTCLIFDIAHIGCVLLKNSGTKPLPFAWEDVVKTWPYLDLGTAYAKKPEILQKAIDVATRFDSIHKTAIIKRMSEIYFYCGQRPTKQKKVICMNSFSSMCDVLNAVIQSWESYQSDGVSAQFIDTNSVPSFTKSAIYLQLSDCSSQDGQHITLALTGGANHPDNLLGYMQWISFKPRNVSFTLAKPDEITLHFDVGEITVSLKSLRENFRDCIRQFSDKIAKFLIGAAAYFLVSILRVKSKKTSEKTSISMPKIGEIIESTLLNITMSLRLRWKLINGIASNNEVSEYVVTLRQQKNVSSNGDSDTLSNEYATILQRLLQAAVDDITSSKKNVEVSLVHNDAVFSTPTRAVFIVCALKVKMCFELSNKQRSSCLLSNLSLEQ